MPTNYDSIAGVYDLFSRIVYGRQIVKAQVCLLPFIPDRGRILIVGGGTGWILEELAKVRSDGLTIDYVESSARMMVLSAKRNCGTNTINLIHAAIENFNNAASYDVILTPFLFDNFNNDKAGLIFLRLNKMLSPHGIFLYADFVYHEDTSWFWQGLLLKIMYLFFRVTCNIETHELVNMENQFVQDFEKIFERSFYFKFIRSVAYRKLSSANT